MRIGTWNIYGMAGFPRDRAAEALGATDSPRRLAAFLEALATLDCDLLLIQEGVDHGRMRGVADALGCKVATLASPGRWPGHVLVRGRILDVRPLSRPTDEAGGDGVFSRMAGVVDVTVGGLRLAVVAVHLHPRDAGLRRAEGQAVAEAIDGLCDVDAAVVAGDFNSEAPEFVHRALLARGFRNALELAGKAPRATKHRNNPPPHAVDHIYLDGRLAGRLRSARVVDDARFAEAAGIDDTGWVFSDHLPVVCELDDEATA